MDIFEGKENRELFFTSFADDLGSQLEQLKFEYEAIENGTFKDPEVKSDSVDLEEKVTQQLEQNLSASSPFIDQHDEKEQKHGRTYTMSIQRAFSTVSLMTFKSNFWKHKRQGRHGRDDKSEENERQRRDSTSSENHEKNNNGLPSIKVNGESEGRATIYSTMVRPKSKKVARSHTMSPGTARPMDRASATLSDQLEPIRRSESGNIYVPPVMVDGQLVYDYQYSTPLEGSPQAKQSKGGKLHRRNSLSRLLRLRKSPKKSPHKENSTPLKVLYQQTVQNYCENNGNEEMAGKPESIPIEITQVEKETST